MEAVLLSSRHIHSNFPKIRKQEIDSVIIESVLTGPKAEATKQEF